MEDPGCKAGRLISNIPVRGPEAKKIRSLLIFDEAKEILPLLFEPGVLMFFSIDKGRFDIVEMLFFNKPKPNLVKNQVRSVVAH